MTSPSTRAASGSQADARPGPLAAAGPGSLADARPGSQAAAGPGSPIGSADITGARAMFAADAASHAAGMQLCDEGPGRATVRMRLRADMVNGHHIAHGGYVFLLADTAFACACNEPGAVTVAAGADITFLAPARVGDELTAVAQLRSGRGRSGIYDVTVTRVGPDDARSSDTPEVIAEFRGRSRTLPAPQEK